MMERYLNRLEGKAWIAAHRGAAGGNIPCNSIPAFQAALYEQADVIELDISESLDGTFYVFHPRMEPVFLRSEKYISQMRDSEVDSLRLHNGDMTPTEWGVPRFDDVLDLLKGRCVINVDKFWINIPGIAAKIRAHGMQDQVIVKTAVTPDCLAQVEEYAADMPFMPLVDKDDGTHERLLGNRRIRYIGMEVAFSDEKSPMASEGFIEKVHGDGCILWLNTIVFNCRTQLAARHSDDTAMSGELDRGWGWAIEKGYDILQTDWPLALRLYGTRRYPGRVVPLRV